MVHQLTHTHREGTYLGRHQHIRAAGGLGTALQRSVVDGAHLVGMIGEVGGRAGIIERELSADEQRALVVAGREGTAEGGTRLAVRHVAVGEEDALRGGKTVSYMAGLTHKAVLHLHAIDDARAVAYNRVLANHSRTDIYRVVGPVQDRAVAHARGAVDLAIVVNDGIGDFLRSHNLHVIADDATLGHVAADILVDESAYLILDVFVGEMLHHECRELAIQVTEDDGVAVARLVEHRDEVALAVGGTFRGLDDAHIRDEAVVANGIVVDVSAHILDEAVVTDGHIAQGGITDAAGLHESLADFHALHKTAHAYRTIEGHISKGRGIEILAHLNGGPVLGGASMLLQDEDFLVS